VNRPAPAARYQVRWEFNQATGAAVVEVSGLSASDLKALGRVEWSPETWATLLTVVVAPENPASDPPPIIGTYRVEDQYLRFRPRFPLEPGLRHRARFRPQKLPNAPPGKDSPLTAEFTRPQPPLAEPAYVVRVDPSGEKVPENLLKLYVHFSRPMGRGESYQHVRLLEASGKPVERPFLEIGEELWDPSGTRLTLLFDPGRIKRGLRPREEEGPILVAGAAYTLVVDRSWPDPDGQPLRETFRKAYRAGPADEVQPNPKSWTVQSPDAGTRDALTLKFPESLDRALLEGLIHVEDARGDTVAGNIAVEAGETRWRFLPEKPWTEGTYRVIVGTALEDLAGNSVGRPFEVDILHPIGPRAETKTVEIPVTVRGVGR
ncbi:Ig-like domain-containing protein, partial [Singulisphaera rosea]